MKFNELCNVSTVLLALTCYDSGNFEMLSFNDETFSGIIRGLQRKPE